MNQDDFEPKSGATANGTEAKAPNQIFLEDIFIVRRAKIYRLREEDWKRAEPRREEDLRDPEIARLMPLIRNEVVVADVSKGDDQGPYTFINLTALAVNKD